MSSQTPFNLKVGQQMPAVNAPVVSKTRRAGNKRGKCSRRGQPHILVVDDMADVTEMIATFLNHAGFTVSTAGSAVTALDLAREEEFDMVISDIAMPQMSGYELAAELRALAKYGSVPLIAVTGFSEYDDRGRALQAGFNAYLTKPIDPPGLLNLIKELLG